MPIQKITSGVVDASVFSSPTISGNLSLDSTGTTGVRVPSANTLTFHTAGSEDMRIDATGNVGIGVTATTQKLYVNGSACFPNDSKLGFHGNPSAATISNYYSGNDTSNYLTMFAGGTERMRIDSSGNLLFNSGYGSVATAYGCRAWVNFQGTGTPAVRASGNVSSITDNGDGDYTINFTNAMPDNLYSVAGAARFNGASDPSAVRYLGISSATSLASVMTTSSVRVVVAYVNGGIQDPDVATVAIHR